MTRCSLPGRRLALRLLLVCSQLAGCAVATGATGGIAALEAGFVAPAAPLPALFNRAQGIALHSCADLIEALQAGKDLGETAELPGFNAYADCLAAQLMASGRARPLSDSDLQNAGERLYRDLDLAGVASSLAPQRPAEHYRLQDLAFDAVQREPLALSLQGHGFAYRLEVLAMGDFQGLGRTEWLVRFTDRATTQGSYNKRTVLVVDAPAPPQALQAHDAMDVIRAQKPGAKM